ncbi:uncharacterized protein LOC120267490 [Dioscorea cayenensis subsp. rotundata]|uniref:Uncharacterized protein LOC120267490 n=1 Tax=Dioscorea cayennensis subsp. rotundata TaxID=55577 RepID=A0AB40BVY0_DIOCR|nr:uncharacterized protein LOC120267490 [Dioscorea cayenensis subsp. rotundata]
MASSSQQDLESNVGSLFPLPATAAAAKKDSLASPRFMKTLPRKGSQRVGEKTAEVDLARSSDGGTDKEAFILQVADEGEGCMVNHATTPTAKWKRIPGRRSSSWIDPRRVLIFFATLSSMGTLILLYFTISMSMANSDANAR